MRVRRFHVGEAWTKAQSGKVSACGVQGLDRRSVWLVSSEHEGEWRRGGQGDRSGQGHTGPQGPWRSSLDLFRCSGKTLGPGELFYWGTLRTSCWKPE